VRQLSGEHHGGRKSILVEACLTGDPRLVFQSIAYDPLTASVLSLAEIRAMVRIPHYSAFQDTLRTRSVQGQAQ
jgi:hypothetical protein